MHAPVCQLIVGNLSCKEHRTYQDFHIVTTVESQILAHQQLFCCMTLYANLVLASTVNTEIGMDVKEELFLAMMLFSFVCSQMIHFI